MSESLALVVDEEVQVFGGYGYSKDYPAERAYRDARISRIYEGTNEINRIVIANQLLRRARAGELALFETAERSLPIDTTTSDTLLLSAANITFSDELLMLKAAKAMTLSSIQSVERAYGERARDEQESLGLVSDMVMNVYAVESALLRTQKLIAARGADDCTIQIEITRVWAQEAAQIVERAARLIAAETDDHESAAAIDEIAHRAPIKMIAARRRIADAIIAAGRYNLS
jgi:butyryl-CoA dehydrogenase